MNPITIFVAAGNSLHVKLSRLRLMKLLSPPSWRGFRPGSLSLHLLFDGLDDRFGPDLETFGVGMESIQYEFLIDALIGFRNFAPMFI